MSIQAFSYRILCLFYAAAIVFYVPEQACAQTIKFKNLGTDNGLSVGCIQGLMQDKKGFMWFATQDGLNKYDGYEVTVYRNNPKSNSTLSNNDILAIYEDRQGKIWVGTNGGGLEEYNPVLNQFIHHRFNAGDKESISSNTVKCIFEDKEGMLWLGTDNGLNAYDRKTNSFARYYSKEKCSTCISGNQVYCITQTPDGTIWIGTLDGGLSSYNKKTRYFTQYTIPQKFDYQGAYKYMNEYRKRVFSLYAKNDGILLVGTDGGGLGVFDYQNYQYRDFVDFNVNPNSKGAVSENNRIWSIAEDSKGNFWLAAYGGGLIQYNSITQKYSFHLKKNNDASSLNSNDVTKVYVDLQDNLWVGTQNAGVNMYFSSSLKFRHIQNNPEASVSLPNQMVFTIFQDKEDIIWIGTDGGGMFSLDLQSGKITDHNDILKHISNKSVLALIKDKDDDLWIGTWGSGLLHYNFKTKKTETFLDGDPKYATIVSLFQDSYGSVWAGTFEGGIFRFDKNEKSPRKYSSENGLPDDAIFSIYEDSGHNLWIGSEGGGACKKNILDFDKPASKFSIYSRKENENTISSDKVFCFYEDTQKNMWIGTSNGLNKIEKASGKMNFWHETDGLPNATIYGIIPDGKGNLWLTTNKGLSRFNPNIENSDGSAFKNFDVKDGLQGMEFNQGAYFKGNKGLIFVGGENGLNVFNPDNIKDNPHIPPVYISSYKRFGKEVELDTSIAGKKYIELDYRDNFFSFDFVALDYLMPSKNKFSYKMEGVDENWSIPSTFRHASYTQLNGGDYIFKVKAANSDGVWNDKPYEIHIRINPPWWKTKWFYTLSIVLITAGVFGFVTYRTASIKKENRILEHKVAERTYELEQKNKDILSSITYAKRIQEAILPPRDQIFKKLPDSFILYKPKDIVSGDFYWFGEKNNLKIFAVVDCTGHGVPGAFMSMIGHNLLNQIIIENGVVDPGSILNALHSNVQAALKQGVNEINTADGMDVALCVINTATLEIKYAGANRSLVIVNSKSELEKLEGNKFPIGGAQLDTSRNFASHIKTLLKGDTLYMFSDGYADQFGGEKGKKFMVKRFHEFLCSIQDKPMPVQGELLIENIENWRGSYEQVDDILVVGIRL